MSILTKFFGDPNKRVLNKLKPIIDQINKLEPEFERLSDEKLKKKTEEFRKRFSLSHGKVETQNPNSSVNYGKAEPRETMNDILPEAFACVREAAKRTLGQRHFDVQLLGGIVLHRGEIAEMKTGEGKTLSATLPIYLNALTGKGVHVVTVNDYLAKRDAQWMAPIYAVLGLSVGCIQHEQAYVFSLEGKNKFQIPNSKKENLQPTSYPGLAPRSGAGKIQANFVSRKEAYQADILYGTNNEFGFDYLRDNMVNSLDEMVQRKLNYAIIDEVDGILIDEARTPLIISGPAERPAEMYFQFARLIKTLQENEDYNIDEKMKAATLTEKGISKIEKALGLENIYAQGGISMVHHLEQALKAETLFKRDRDYLIKKGEIIIIDEFTGRLMYGRRYSEGLHQAIEAKEGVEIKRESITLATITFQNYFRLYKKLAGMTGTAITSAEEFHKVYNLESVVIPPNKPMIRDDKADVIYKTEQGKFKAIVEEIKARHKKGQPVLVGTISIEKNEILGEMLDQEGIPHQILNAKYHEKEATIISQTGRIGAVTVATNMAGRGVDIILGGKPPKDDKSEIRNPKSLPSPKRSSGFAQAGETNSKFQIPNSKPSIPTSYKLQATSYKEWQKEHNQIIKLGGLHIIGTERHEARRIDNQLRGRAGRQGDIGSSQFYVSMEDDIMRIFGSKKMKGLMDRLGVPENMPIEHKMISNAIESAQKKVEGYNFDLRKHLLEYDDVINKHREVIYKKRRTILENIQHPTSNTQHLILGMIENEIEQVVSFHTAQENEKDWNLKEIYEVVGTIFPLPKETRLKLEDIQEEAGDANQDAKARTKIICYLVNLSRKSYNDLEERITNQLTANNQQLTIKNPMREIEKGIMLRTIDSLWVEHLEAIDHLRTGIGLRAYGQREPLIEYKKESFRLFNELMNLIQKQVVYSIYKIGLAVEIAPSIIQKPGEIKLTAPSKTMDEGKKQFALSDSQPTSPSQTISSGTLAPGRRRKIGRNEPCPCGSGKKYKKCHGR